MNVYLRALEMSDVEKLVKWRNDKEVTSSLGGNTFFVSKLRESEWLKNVILNDMRNVVLAICLNEKGNYIGNVSVNDINLISRSGHFSIMIGEKKFWNKGFGTEATKLMLRYAFEERNLNRISLCLRKDNLRAMTVYKKIGFQQEGILREAVYKEGRYMDLVQMSILKKEFMDGST